MKETEAWSLIVSVFQLLEPSFKELWQFSRDFWTLRQKHILWWSVSATEAESVKILRPRKK